MMFGSYGIPPFKGSNQIIHQSIEKDGIISRGKIMFLLPSMWVWRKVGPDAMKCWVSLLGSISLQHFQVGHLLQSQPVHSYS